MKLEDMQAIPADCNDSKETVLKFLRAHTCLVGPLSVCWPKYFIPVNFLLCFLPSGVDLIVCKTKPYFQFLHDTFLHSAHFWASNSCSPTYKLSVAYFSKLYLTLCVTT